MLRTLTFEEKIEAYSWPDGSAETKNFFKTLSVKKLNKLLSHYQTLDKNSLPIGEVIHSALALKKNLENLITEENLSKALPETLKKMNIPLMPCNFHIMTSIPTDTDAYRSSYILLLKPNSGLQSKPSDQHRNLSEVIYDLLDRDKKPLFITLDGKIESVPIIDIYKMIANLLVLLPKDAKAAKGFTLEKIKNLCLHLTEQEIQAFITSNGKHTPITSNTIDRTLRYFKQEKYHEKISFNCIN